MWWGAYRLEEGALGRWRIGALSLWIRHRAHEWMIHSSSTNDGLASEIEVDVPSNAEEPQKGVKISRYVFRQTDQRLSLEAALADRPVVAHPHIPLSLLPKESVTVYVTTPLWVQIKNGEPKRMLQELPIYRPSDTWFGPSTTNGELCYASGTSARLRFDEMPAQSVRALTAVHLENRARQPMQIERISIPVPFLSLFIDKNNAFWTQSVTIARDEDGDSAQVRLSDEPDREADTPKRLHGPRQDINRSAFVRAFSALLG